MMGFSTSSCAQQVHQAALHRLLQDEHQRELCQLGKAFTVERLRVPDLVGSALAWHHPASWLRIKHIEQDGGCVCCVLGRGTALGGGGGKGQPSTIAMAGIWQCRLRPYTCQILHTPSQPWPRQEMAAQPVCLCQPCVLRGWVPLPARVPPSVPASATRSCPLWHGAPVPCGTVLLAVRHNPAAAGRGARPGWVQRSLAPLTVRAPLNTRLLPDWGGPIPHLPSPLPAPDLGVSRPQGPSAPALALLIDRAGGCRAGTPRPRPFISSAVGLHHVSCRCTCAPGSQHRAAATCVPAVPTATLPAWPCCPAATPMGLEPLVPQPRQAVGQGLCPCPPVALEAVAAPRPAPLAPQSLGLYGVPNTIPKVSASCCGEAPAWCRETRGPSTPRDPVCPHGWTPPARSQGPPQSGSGVLSLSPSCGGATSA